MPVNTFAVLCALICKFYFDEAVTLPLLHPGTGATSLYITSFFFKLQIPQFTTISSIRTAHGIHGQQAVKHYPIKLQRAEPQSVTIPSHMASPFSPTLVLNS